MKKYIKAAYDPSMPEWLRVKSDSNKKALEALNYNYAMGSAKFYDEPQPNSIPIYLIYDVLKANHRWGGRDKLNEYVYIPDMPYTGDEIYINVGSTVRQLDKASKAKLQNHIADTVYMVAEPVYEYRKNNNRDYVDPRYDRTRFDSNHWKYQGQHPAYDDIWDADKNKWVPNKNKIDGWYTRHHRDKSGYEIPDPQELYERLYKRFPDRTQGKLNEAKRLLDEYYDKLDNAKSRIFNQYDIRKGKYAYFYSHSVYDSAIYNLNEAIQHYGNIYRTFENLINEDGTADSKALSEFMNSNSYDSLQHGCRAIDKCLDKIEKALR